MSAVDLSDHVPAYRPFADCIRIRILSTADVIAAEQGDDPVIKMGGKPNNTAVCQVGVL